MSKNIATKKPAIKTAARKLVAVAPQPPLVDRLVASREAAEAAERAYRLLCEEFMATRPEGSAELTSDGRRVTHVAASSGALTVDERRLTDVYVHQLGNEPLPDPVQTMASALRDNEMVVPTKYSGARKASVRVS